MPAYVRERFSVAVGSLAAPAELVDNDETDDLGPYQLTVTPGEDETVAAQIRLYEADRTVAANNVQAAANLLERFDVPYDGPRDVTVRLVPAGKKLWIATPDDATSTHRATIDLVDPSGLT